MIQFSMPHVILGTNWLFVDVVHVSPVLLVPALTLIGLLKEKLNMLYDAETYNKFAVSLSFCYFMEGFSVVEDCGGDKFCNLT